MTHDVRFALRMIVSHRWFSAAIVATLALGIGLNTMVFTLVNAVLLKPVGLVGTLAATTILASAAGTLLRPLALAMLVAIMVVANVGIFVFALNMPIPLWPAIF